MRRHGDPRHSNVFHVGEAVRREELAQGLVGEPVEATVAVIELERREQRIGARAARNRVDGEKVRPVRIEAQALLDVEGQAVGADRPVRFNAAAPSLQLARADNNGGPGP
jgi:hypothetical protein